MISWHKPGQKVTPVDGDQEIWSRSDCLKHKNGPRFGEVYAVQAVVLARYFHHKPFPAFVFADWPGQCWDAEDFAPVYPTIIDQLRTLPSPTPERVKEDA